MRKLFYMIFFIVTSAFLTIIFYPKIIDKSKYFFLKIKFHPVYQSIESPILKSCFFQESKMACLIKDREKSINPNCFIRESLLQDKFREGLPKWAKDQIQEDLSKFPVIKKSDLKRFFNENTEKNNILAFIQVKDKEVKITHRVPCNMVTDGMSCIYGEGIMQYVLEYLAKRNYIPDLEFLISFSDFYTPISNKSIPIFSFAKDLDVAVEKDLILIPDWQNLGSAPDLRERIKRANNLISWEDKKDKIFWRGGKQDSTGFRKKLVLFAKKHPDLIDAEFITAYGEKKIKGFVTPEEHLQYKYLISIDGKRASWERLIWHLHSNSLVFKNQSNQIQWFYKGTKPFVHYIPVTDEKNMLKNINWAEKHPKEVQVIIHNASTFVDKNLSLEDMYHYMAVLLQEYHKKVVD